MVESSPHLWVGITDSDWFRYHSAKVKIEEVNFWSPSSKVGFRALKLGQPLLFKLKSPRNVIAGGGFFAKFEFLPLTRAWETFGEANGAGTFEDFRFLILRNRYEKFSSEDDPLIGCTALSEPFFFKENDWIPIPDDFGRRRRGRSYDITTGTGLKLWNDVRDRLTVARIKSDGPATSVAIERARYGQPALVMPRLGQGSFRLMITDAYQRRCAITSERTLPALEAAHIHRYSHGGDHSLSNGLLLRSDLHRLFDRGYLAIEPRALTVQVSPRIREEFENGRDYYALEGRKLTKPKNPLAFPSIERLIHHYESVFKKTS